MAINRIIFENPVFGLNNAENEEMSTLAREESKSVKVEDELMTVSGLKVKTGNNSRIHVLNMTELNTTV